MEASGYTNDHNNSSFNNRSDFISEATPRLFYLWEQ